ncbi:MAG: LysR family transcriptional regulator, partial [Deltaproteobacteria bacterium]|nr:LysR family transcriptional regulator [Deltaproteobacteria bacterium]
QRLAAAAGSIESAAEGVVRITAPPGVADAFIAPALVELYRRYPLIRIELDARIAVVDLTRGEADLALRSIRPTGGDLVMVRLAQVRSVPMANRAYATELGTLRSLEAARWIMWGPDLAHLPEQRWLDHHVEVTPTLRTSHFPSQLAAAVAGLGAVVAPEPYAAVHGLVALEHSRGLAEAWRALPVGELWLVGHRALREVPRVAAVWEFLVAMFQRAARPA